MLLDNLRSWTKYHCADDSHLWLNSLSLESTIQPDQSAYTQLLTSLHVAADQQLWCHLPVCHLLCKPPGSTRSLDETAVILFQDKRDGKTLIPQTGVTSAGGSSANMLQGRKRKAPEAAGEFLQCLSSVKPRESQLSQALQPGQYSVRSEFVIACRSYIVGTANSKQHSTGSLQKPNELMLFPDDKRLCI